MIEADRHNLGALLKEKHFDVVMDVILDKKPKQHIFNVGNELSVSIKEWVILCYQAAGKEAEFVNVYEDIEQRNYFSFYNYEYVLDVTKQKELLPQTLEIQKGLCECFEWYEKNQDKVNKKLYFEFIDKNLK